MAYKYEHFIPQNTAPKGTKHIGVYRNGEKVATIPLGRMTPPTSEPLYSFGIVSDIHLWKFDTSIYANSNSKFDHALALLQGEGCAFCVVSGDLTVTGLYLSPDDTPANAYLDEEQFSAYQAICQKYTMPVYALMGNHESYYGKPISDHLDLMASYTGNSALSYTVEHGNDVFILVGQPRDAWVMSSEDFTWLENTLEANKDKRCFVFIHSHIDDNVEGGVEDSGNPVFARANSIFGNGYWGAENRTNFINLMKQYPNAILFHGHTHIMFEAQQFDKDANYSEENGFKSVHVPSCGVPREVLSENGTWEPRNAGAQGYIVDVYDDCVVLNGMDFVNNVCVPLGVLKIET